MIGKAKYFSLTLPIWSARIWAKHARHQTCKKPKKEKIDDLGDIM